MILIYKFKYKCVIILMASKEELVNIIKEWIEIDDMLKQKQKEIKELKGKKKIFTETLLEIMKKNEIDCFDINSGKIVYCKTKSKASINKKNLLESLEKYFEDREDIDITKVRDYLFENRETKLRENIKRKIV